VLRGKPTLCLIQGIDAQPSSWKFTPSAILIESLVGVDLLTDGGVGNPTVFGVQTQLLPESAQLHVPPEMVHRPAVPKSYMRHEQTSAPSLCADVSGKWLILVPLSPDLS